MSTETLKQTNCAHATLPPTAPKPLTPNGRSSEPYMRWLMGLLMLAGIAVIAYVDWNVRALSLGFLYVFPLAFGAIVLPRRIVLSFVPMCVFLVDWLGPYEHMGWHLIWRNLISLSGFLAVVLVIANLVEQRRRLTETVRLQRDEMAKDIALAAQVQRRMLPQFAPVYAGLELAARMQSARVVAGDYYDFMELEDGNLGLVVADVAGKGVQAGLLAPTLKATLWLEAPRARQSQEVVTDLNRLLYDLTEEARYVTLFYGILNPRTQALRYTNAGHLPGLLFKAATREIVWLEKGGLALGLFAGMKYESEQVQLGQNDILALYSDGIVEAENQRGEDYSRERLAELIASNNTLTAEALLDIVFANVASYTQQQALADDQTLLILKSIVTPK